MAKVRRRKKSTMFSQARKKTSKAAARVRDNPNTKLKQEKFELGKLPKMLKGKKPACMLLDGDILVFHCTTAGLAERRNAQGEYSWTLDGTHCQEAIAERIDGLLAWMKAKHHVIAFGGRENFRKQLLPGYKAHRAQKKPLGYFDMVEWVCENWNGVRWPKCEADDILGIHATDPAVKRKFTPLIVSDDKDLDTIPGLHMCLKKPVDENRQGVYEVSLEKANLSVFIQALSGDSGDGYHGLKGIGPVKAKDILIERPVKWSAWKAVVNAYEESGQDAAAAKVQTLCARILRHGEYNPKTNKFKLWNPNSRSKRC